MVTKLIVASGKSAGRSIAIKRNKLLVGRSEECDVRPLSEEVSRRHCAVHVGPADVWVEDLGSRNGTFVNGERIAAKIRVKDGDIIRVGTLELKVSCTEPSAKAGTEDDVSRWLVADDKPAGMFDTTHTLAVAPTDEPSAPAAVGAGARRPLPTAEEAVAEVGSTAAIEAAKAPGKDKPGTLPATPRKTADSSRDAAAEALKKFFEKR